MREILGKILGVFIVIAVSVLVGYAIMAFGIGALNPMLWSPAARFIMVAFAGLIAGFWSGTIELPQIDPSRPLPADGVIR